MTCGLIAGCATDDVAGVPDARSQAAEKAGDSITVAPQFMACFAGTHVALGENGDLASDSALFAAGDAAGTSPFARYALVMFGTNPMGPRGPASTCFWSSRNDLEECSSTRGTPSGRAALGTAHASPPRTISTLERTRRWPTTSTTSSPRAPARRRASRPA